ncbi:hypothetical protein COLO4_31523 [Corchorus olitorius]|uniref:COP1-interacting protein 7 n=1 Tax=Corchorus olitorius TaxID=93759 RepID=A0A1R3H469_9ROSI|nr:hypothetical protein COLO4_31523 [Corchorus olitorius]
MDSTTLLDRALFQLTPTRTRDQISKGGYSITLQPPAPGTLWFTKATFQRFVCFVSTPAVLERFVSIEREILQIERSIQDNELNANADGRQDEDANGNTKKSTDFTKDNDEPKIKEESTQKENSKVQLQRLLETRKALLRTEQAMTYARGLVAGFAMENMEDLISFADAFGAARLREACINFKELCKKKLADRLWMEELAAVEVCSPSELPLGTSGIVLANGIMPNFPINGAPAGDQSSNGSSESSNGAVDGKKDGNLPASDQIPSTTTKYQMPMHWPHQIPQHMYNLQGSGQQLPPYQGYPFHPVQPVPLPYPMNMQWTPNRNQKSSSRRKKKSLNGKRLEYSGEETETESSGSDSGSESSSDKQEERRQSSPDPPSRKKNSKKSSKTVVIRNINYITPERRRSGEKGKVSDGSYSGEEDLIDADSLKMKVDDAVKSLKEASKLNKRRGADKSRDTANKSDDDSHQNNSNVQEEGKTNENWDAFKSLLMRDEENASMKEVEWKQSADFQEQYMARNFDGEISATSQKVPIQRTVMGDSFVMTERDGKDETRKLDDFFNGDNYRPVMKRRDSAEIDLLRPERSEESGSKLSNLMSTSANGSSVIRSRKEEDLFAGNHYVRPGNQDSANYQMLFNGDHISSAESDPLYSQKSRKDILIDDSFMVTARAEGDDQDDSQWKTDISVVADLTSSTNPDGNIDASQNEHKILDSNEPDDLFMVLERNPGYDSSRDSWTMDYQIDLSFSEPSRSAATENAEEKAPSDDKKQNGAAGMKKPAKEARSKILNGSLGKSKAENIYKSKRPSLVSRSVSQKSKLEKEEEMRKKMEKLLLERQKRIAERTAASANASAVNKRSSLESKAAKSSTKSDKNKNLSPAAATNRVSSMKLRAST